jgi:hypothetical protein
MMAAKKKTQKKTYLLMDVYSNEILFHGEMDDLNKELERIILEEGNITDLEVCETTPMKLVIKAVLEKK